MRRPLGSSRRQGDPSVRQDAGDDGVADRHAAEGHGEPVNDTVTSAARSDDAGSFLQCAKEFPELKRLREQALLRERERQIVRSKSAAWPRWSLLRIVLWKNLTIRRRRKTQFFLLLFQIFLWFGIACFSIAFRNTRYHYPEEPYAKPTQLVPRIRSADLSLPIAISYTPHRLDLQELLQDDGRGVASNFAVNQSMPSGGLRRPTAAERTIAQLMQRVLAYYGITYNGLEPPLRLFRNESELIARMTADQRIPYGIHFDSLDLDKDDGLIRYRLMFWEKEVPTDDSAFNVYDCRKLDQSIYFRPGICSMALYGKHGFMFAQAAVNTAIMDLIAQRRGIPRKAPSVILKEETSAAERPSRSGAGYERAELVDDEVGGSFLSYRETEQGVKRGQLQNPFSSELAFIDTTLRNSSLARLTPDPWAPVLPLNRFRLELPSVSVVAERYPEHDAVRSQAAEAAVTAPFYFMLALVSVFSFVVMDMVAEKESKVKEIMKTYGLSSSMFWLSWLLTYALLNVVIVWCAVFLCTIGGVFGPVTSIFVVSSLFYMYLLSLITFGFMVSVFFQKAHIASTAGMVFNLVLYVLGRVIHQARIANCVVRGFFMLFSTITFSLSVIDLISLLPDHGVTVMDLFDFSSPNQSVGIHLFFLTFDTFLYFALAWYLDQVVQSDWGGTKHWTFVFGYLREHLRKGFQKVVAFFSRSRSGERGDAFDAQPLLQRNGREAQAAGPSAADGDDLEDLCVSLNAEWVEPVSQEVRARGVAVRVRHLLKSFPVRKKQHEQNSFGRNRGRVVVDDLNLDLYPGEVFGLLGHNGAGKTTTISMLTGMLQIDEGDAVIHGHSIRHDSERARKLISVCPQQNFFFEDLTCLEHVIFFAALRGIDVHEGLELANSAAYFYDLVVQKRFLTEQRKKIVDTLIHMDGVTTQSQRSAILEMEQHFAKFGLSLFTDPDLHFVHYGQRTVVSASTWAGILALIEKVGLSEKMFHTPRMLSGGMKRRLWLAIALIGDPKVVFLDEPTSGVDPLGRQELWRLIEDEKAAGRCLVVTTHHMEEADILADRKAIMTAGRIRCVGTSLFLKSRFGIGYYLEIGLEHTVAVSPSSLDQAARRLLALISPYVPGVKRHINDTRSAKSSVTPSERSRKDNAHRSQSPAAAGAGRSPYESPGSAAAAAARTTRGNGDRAHQSDAFVSEGVQGKDTILVFSLPLASVGQFPKLFEALEQQKVELGIREYGVSLTTLEEVFFRLGEEESESAEEPSSEGGHLVSQMTSSRALENIVARERGSVLGPGRAVTSSCAVLPASESQQPLEKSPTVSSLDEEYAEDNWVHPAKNDEREAVTPGVEPCTIHSDGILPQKTLPPLKYGAYGDLVSQKIVRSSYGSRWTYLRAMISLRWLQIIHNKTVFCVDVIFPVIMLLISLFFRDGGPGGLNSLVKRDNTLAIPMYQYGSVFNTTIPYTIDARLSGGALREAYGLMSAFPPDIRALLHRVDILEEDYLDRLFASAPKVHSAVLANTTSGGQLTGLGTPPSLAQDQRSRTVMGDDDDDDDDDDDEDNQLAWMAGLSGPVERVPVHVSVQDTPIGGRALRNYLFVKRDKRAVKVVPRYSAGFSFEPRTSHVMPKPGQGVWSDGSSLQIRIFYDSGLDHSLPVLFSLISDASLQYHLKSAPAATAAGLKESPHAASSTVLHDARVESSGSQQGSSRIRTESVPLFMEIPTFVTSLTYGMYIMLTVGLSILPSRFGIQIMMDKSGGTKHAMIVMGLPFSYYWCGSFLMNYLAMLFGNGVMCVCIAYFIPLFWSFAIVPVMICALFYSASVLLYSYFLSQLFYNLKAYAMTLQLTGMLFALCPAYLVSVFADAANSGARWSSLMFLSHAVSSFLFPPYNPIGVLTGCAVVVTEYQQRGRLPRLVEYFALDRLPMWSIIGTAVQAIVLFLGTVWIDRRHYMGRKTPVVARDLLDMYYQKRETRRQEWLRRVGGHQVLIPASLQNHKDEDVHNEEKECVKIRRILEGQERAYAAAAGEQEKQGLRDTFQWMALEDPEFPSELPLVLIDDLHYMFVPNSPQQVPHVAVRGFSLRVYRGDIFGLLGPNGAGKTTSLNLLTCHYMTAAPTRGLAFLGGHNICVNPSLAFSHLGLCPQFDALWGDITVRDNIKIFARIKHVPENEIETVIDGYIQDLELEAHQYKRISECSGGNKRRVSVAVAFIGDPDVVLMDEPSSGIDPVGRRRLAELIHKNAKSRCVVLTTHSMEEAEALCSKIGIIVNGELNCVNTSLAIRSRYGAGIRLEVIFDDRHPNYVGFDPSDVTSHPWQQFLYRHVSPDAKEIHRVANRVTYDLPLRYDSFGRLFSLMETHKDEYAIKDYALSQPTLEQVFISFAKRQKSAQESMQEILKD